MGTYVQLTREDFEEWLNDHGFRGKWRVHPRYDGVYILDLSDTVAISINSTTGMADRVKGKGLASMKMRLVSKVTDKVILGPVKLMGKSHFKRTLNWRDTWGKGLDRARKTYTASKSFYDAVAEISDREQYTQEVLALIESKANWRGEQFLAELHDKVSAGGIITTKQRAVIDRFPDASAGPSREVEDLLAEMRDLYVAARDRGDDWALQFLTSIAETLKAGGSLTSRQQAALDRIRQAPTTDPQPEQDEVLKRLRALYSAARQAGDDWTMQFTQSVAGLVKQGRPLTERQQAVLDEKIRDYRVRTASVPF